MGGEEIIVPIGEVQDDLVWDGSATGKLTMKTAYEQYREKNNVM